MVGWEAATYVIDCFSSNLPRSQCADIQKTNAAGVAITDKSCLIMDEVDGMSAGDRGGVGALTALIKKSKIPIICIANDRGAQKLKPLISATYNLTFKRPEANVVRSRILSIAFKCVRPYTLCPRTCH